MEREEKGGQILTQGEKDAAGASLAALSIISRDHLSIFGPHMSPPVILVARPILLAL